MKKLMLSVASLLTACTIMAQVPASFEEFRQSIMSDYQEFQRTILEHYADFLEGTWHEYEPLEPLKRDAAPKPVKIPDVALDKPSSSPVSLPTPASGQTPEVKPTMPKTPEIIKPTIDTPQPETPAEAKKKIPLTLGVKPGMGIPLLGAVPTIPKPAEPQDEPKVIEMPVSEPDHAERKDIVNFYGMDIPVPRIDFNISQSLDKVSDFGKHWKFMDKQELSAKVKAAVMPVVKDHGLNDYLTYEFLCAYMDSKFPQAGISPRISAVHYMLANMGYNVRIAVITKTGEPVILIPAEQTLYEVPFMHLDGQKFYMFGSKGVNPAGSTLATCNLPKVASSGKKFNMIIDSLNLPVKSRAFDVCYGNLHLSGTINENIIPVVYRYPLMDISDYAISTLDRSLRESLVNQIKEQLDGKESLAATNELLQFVQNGFEYATDGQFHGFEKPYFIEENFYYPKNDCEDRSIFYTYLLWNALGVESHLLAFPGHESAAVYIPGADIKGTNYVHEGKKYFISDPTYIGSRTGQCMRQFENTAPKIDYFYK